MVPSQDARTAAASIALHAATAATHAGCIAVYIADWRRFLWNEDYPPVPNKYFETYIRTKAADDILGYWYDDDDDDDTSAFVDKVVHACSQTKNEADDRYDESIPASDAIKTRKILDSIDSEMNSLWIDSFDDAQPALDRAVHAAHGAGNSASIAAARASLHARNLKQTPTPTTKLTPARRKRLKTKQRQITHKHELNPDPTELSDKPLDKFSLEDVLALLRKLRLDACIPTFVENGVEGADMIDFSDDNYTQDLSE